MSSTNIGTEQILSEDELAAVQSIAAAVRESGDMAGLAAALHETLNVELSVGSDIVGGFAQDSSNLPGHADAVARPGSERECAILLALAHAAKLPVTISGGRSNLTGSATPEGGIVLSTAKLVHPAPELDGESVRAPVGMMLEDLRQAVLDASGGALAFPVDPTSRAEASVGGAIACNASGFTPGPKGAIRDWVDCLRVLLPDGRLVVARRGQYVSEDGAFMVDGQAWTLPRYPRPSIKNAGGPYTAGCGEIDFIDAIVGSEGIFGLVTGCTLRLTTRPQDHLDLFFSLPDEAAAVRLTLAALERFGGNLGQLTAFEYFGIHCRRYMKHEERFFYGDDPVALYIQQPLTDTDALEAAEFWLELMTENGIEVDEEAILLLDTPQLQSLFLEARHSMPANALEVVQHHGTFTIMTDTVVPPERFAEFLESTHALLKEKGLDYLAFGHMGDCHLHFTILPTREQLDDGLACYDEIIATSSRWGGIYSGEHGTGKRKRRDFERCYGTNAVMQVRNAKSALDPENLINRGNVVEAASLE